MTTFAYELAALNAAEERIFAGTAEPLYAVPWYLVLGEPQTGRTSVVRALNLSWPNGEHPLTTNVPGQLCQYWLPEKAVFIEPGSSVVGMARGPQTLMELCQELKVKRPREPLDGCVLVIDARVVADASEETLDRYAKSLRRYLVEVGQALDADVPTYVVVTGIDTLWGFGDAFQWTADRVREEPWGFVLAPTVKGADVPAKVRAELEGLLARMESTCFAKLSSEEPTELRTRAYQHLAEIRDLIERLAEVLAVVTTQNAFERSPWVRALAIGSGLPGTGHRLRHRGDQFIAMGYYPPQPSGTTHPGGMPLHPMLEKVLLPERDLVPTATRWRDDKLTLVLWGFGLVGWLVFVVMWIVSTLTRA
jgi:type VI protein secretion system component VasK